LEVGFDFFFCSTMDLFETFGGKSAFGVDEYDFVLFFGLGGCEDYAEVGFAGATWSVDCGDDVGFVATLEESV